VSPIDKDGPGKRLTAALDKSLKCKNVEHDLPTEWYCEKCGAELSRASKQESPAICGASNFSLTGRLLLGADNLPESRFVPSSAVLVDQALARRAIPATSRLPCRRPAHPSPRLRFDVLDGGAKRGALVAMTTRCLRTVAVAFLAERIRGTATLVKNQAKMEANVARS